MASTANNLSRPQGVPLKLFSVMPIILGETGYRGCKKRRCENFAQKQAPLVAMNQILSEPKRMATTGARPLPGWAQLRETVLDGLGAGLFACDAKKPGFPIIQISPSFTALTAYTNKEALGQKLNFLYGSRTDAVTAQEANRALSRGEQFQGELLCYRADGTTVWCELVIVPRPSADGLPDHFAAALIDISARKQRDDQFREQEANFRGIFENAIEGIYQSTPEGRYLRVNMALARMYGYSSPDALMKQVCDIENQIYVDASMRELFKKLMDEADHVRGLEYQVRRRDGGVIWISENSRMVRDANGKARYYEGFIEEITQRKKAEAALQQSQQRLIETSRQIGLAEITTGLLHNIGNALNSVNISAGVAADKVSHSKVGNLSKAINLLRDHDADLARFITSDPKGRQIIGYLGELAPRLTREQAELKEELTSLKKSLEHANDILACQQNYAKSAGRLETVQPVQLVEDALQMNANSLARHHIRITRDYAPNLPNVSVRKHLILQILVNLIRNAQKACDASDSPDKCVTLRVACRPPDGRIQIDVQDNGVGIPPENLARIFTHGFTTRKDGHGFGLHSGVRMAEEMGGSLTAHSEGVGQGASFILEFPCQTPAPKTGEKTPVS
jgi:PAS domain S-box-containing protein